MRGSCLMSENMENSLENCRMRQTHIEITDDEKNLMKTLTFAFVL